MNRRPTPETDKAKCKFTSLFGDSEDAYWVPLKVARRLEQERDEARFDLEFRRGLFRLQEEQLNAVRVERDEARDEIAKWQQMAVEADKRFVEAVLDVERALAEVYRRKVEALQEQLDTAIMLGKLQERRHERELEQVREQYRLSSVCRELKAENEKLKQQQ